MSNQQGISTYFKDALKAHQLDIPSESHYFNRHKKMIRKRRLMEMYFMFLYQSIATYFMPVDGTILPWYPPLAMAFTMIYLRGLRVAPMLWFAMLVSTLANQVPLIESVCLASANILGAAFGAFCCQSILTTDVKPFARKKTLMQYVLCQMFLTATVATWIKASYFGWWQMNTLLQPQWTQILPVWLSSVNGLVILSTYMLTWLHPPRIQWRWRHLLAFDTPFPYLTGLGLACVALVCSTYAWFLYLLSVPFLGWLAYRFRSYGASAGIFIFAVLYLIHTRFIKTSMAQEFKMVMLQSTGLFVCVCLMYFTASLKKKSELTKVYTQSLG